jgi:outer membrane protein TolC
VREMTDHRVYRRKVVHSRQRWARRRAWVAAISSIALVMLPTGLSIADPRPLIPPLACCNNYKTPCPSAAASCIALPYIPVTGPGYSGAPATRVWNLTIQEAVQVAIGNSEAVRNLGLVEAASKNDLVRSVITSYDPVQAALKADAQWGIFDPLWTTSIAWNRQDIPPGTSFSGIGNRPPMLDTSDFGTSIEQLLPIGTRVRVDSVTNYLFNPANPPNLLINPQYFSYTQFGFSHPFLQGAGVGVTMAPIKIASAQAEQTSWQFKQEMLALVRSVETTYWSLYAQQQNLRAIEEVLPLFRETVRLRQQQAGVEVGTESEVYRAQSDLLLYEQRRLDTMSRIAEQQLVLRNLMGLSPSDDVALWTLAAPETGRPLESLQDAVLTAINRRPDVLRQRLAVFVAQQERILADNALKPRLDATGYYRLNGLDDNLGGSWGVQTNHDYRDWQLGALFEIPLGRRQGFSNLRAADYKISRERAMLEQVAHQASFEVADAYRRINWVSQQRLLVVDRGTALKQWRSGAQAQFENPPPGMSTAFALELYLQNLRDMLEASMNGNALLADYNSALARLDEVKGTLLDRRFVQISGDLSEEVPADLPKPQLEQPDSVLPAPSNPAPRAPENQQPAAPKSQDGAGIQAPEPGTADAIAQVELQPLPTVDESIGLQAALPELRQESRTPDIAAPPESISLALPQSMQPRLQTDVVNDIGAPLAHDPVVSQEVAYPDVAVSPEVDGSFPRSAAAPEDITLELPQAVRLPMRTDVVSDIGAPPVRESMNFADNAPYQAATEPSSVGLRHESEGVRNLETVNGDGPELGENPMAIANPQLEQPSTIAHRSSEQSIVIARKAPEPTAEAPVQVLAQPLAQPLRVTTVVPAVTPPLVTPLRYPHSVTSPSQRAVLPQRMPQIQQPASVATADSLNR